MSKAEEAFSWIRENALHWIAVSLMGFLVLFIVLVICVLPFSIKADLDREKQMIERCTPDPSLFECQLYLAKKGQTAILNSAQGGAMIGGMIGGSIGRVAK